MLLSLCHNQIVGFLYSVARILEPKLCTYSVAGDKISVSLKISIQLLNPVFALDKAHIQAFQIRSGSLYVTNPEYPSQRLPDLITLLGPLDAQAQVFSAFLIQMIPIQDNAEKSLLAFGAYIRYASNMMH